MCRGTRVCQCLPVSTPTYLCKSFNLTPPACRAYPERDRISKPIRIHCLDGGERGRAASTHSSYTIAFLLSTIANRVYIDVKSCATRALRASLHPRRYLRKLMYLRFDRTPITRIWYRICVYGVTKKRRVVRFLLKCISVFIRARGIVKAIENKRFAQFFKRSLI